MLWDVHLLADRYEPDFVVTVESETEAGALAEALRFFPWTWVSFTTAHKEE